MFALAGTKTVGVEIEASPVTSALQVVIAEGFARLRLVPFVNSASVRDVAIGKYPHDILVHARDADTFLSPHVNEAVLTPFAAPRVLNFPVRKTTFLNVQANECDSMIIVCWASMGGGQDTTGVPSPAVIASCHVNHVWTPFF